MIFRGLSSILLRFRVQLISLSRFRFFLFYVASYSFFFFNRLILLISRNLYRKRFSINNMEHEFPSSIPYRMIFIWIIKKVSDNVEKQQHILKSLSYFKRFLFYLNSLSSHTSYFNSIIRNDHLSNHGLRYHRANIAPNIG